VNRDEAIRIAANALPNDGRGPRAWAEIVVNRANSLLAALGEPKAEPLNPCEGGHAWEWIAARGEMFCPRCCMTATRAEAIPNDQRVCCAATEARVVREIADYLDNGGYSGAGAIVRCGDWRSKGPR